MNIELKKPNCKIDYIDHFYNRSVATTENTLRILRDSNVIDNKGIVHNAFEFYSEKSTSRKNPINIGGYIFYISDVCSNGNSKVNKCCLVTKLLPIVTCPNCESCMHTCYALKATIQYDYTFYFELFSTYLAVNRPFEYVDMIARQIIKSKKTHVRLHESGDLFSDEYIKAIESLIARFPEVTFHTFSKVYFGLDRFPNCNTVRSIIRLEEVDDKGNKIITYYRNYGDAEYLEMLKAKLRKYGIKYAVCPNKKNDGSCIGKCHLCEKVNHVLFPMH